MWLLPGPEQGLDAGVDGQAHRVAAVPGDRGSD